MTQASPLTPAAATTFAAVMPPPSPRPPTNPEAELARGFVLDTDRHVFLTGRAGTGKTTFLRQLREGPLSRKRHVVVAPTGVAAINAGGATIHSTFGLPFGVLTPELLRPGKGRPTLSKRKARVLRSIDLLVVDEVSMVRADVLDAIDHVLRRVRRSRAAFGGVQLLLIGDLHQLPPVVTRDEESAMAARYATPFFFGAEVLKQAELVTVELRHVYRQSDADFVALLGEVRAGRMTRRVLNALNARHVDPSAAGFPGPGAGYITLTSHRHTAREINGRRLAEVPGAIARYRAEVTGKFPPSAYPVDETLELKVGAQVMFVKNDPEGAFYNGKIGTVTALTEGRVTVDCEGDDAAIEVGRLAWENTTYSLDESDKSVTTDVAGRFRQIPLRLAWAITIHKSQGLTFDRVVIDAAAAFAHGQVYVALSRCRSLGGIVLRTPLDERCVPTDAEVAGYTEAARDAAPGADALDAARRTYRRALLPRAFDLGALSRAVRAMLKFYLRNEASYARRQGSAFDAAVRLAQQEVFAVAAGFRQPLAELVAAMDPGRERIDVPERAQRGAVYLHTKLTEGLGAFLATLDLVTDNQQVERRTADLWQDLGRELRTALAGLRVAEAESFTVAEFERARADAGLGEAAVSKRAKRTARAAAPEATSPHPELLAVLIEWRRVRAAAQGIPAYRVASTRTLREIAATLPTSSADLRRIHGVGAVKVAEYGGEFVDRVAQYCRERGIDPSAQGGAAAPQLDLHGGRSVSATVALSLSMFARGLSPAEIAAERELRESTVRGHLAHGVDAGRIEIEQLVEPAVLERVAAYFDPAAGEPDVKTAFGHFGGEVDFETLRMVRDLVRG